MKILILILLSLTYSFAQGLQLQEAINLALKHHDQIKEQEYILKQKEAQANGAYGAFLPQVNLTYSLFNNPQIKNASDTKRGDSSALEVRYNLFNGMADFWNQQSLKNAKEAQYFQLQSTQENIKLLVKEVFFGVLNAKQNLQIAKESLLLLEQQTKDAKAFWEQGVSAKNDYLNAEVQYYNAKQILLSANSALKMGEQNLWRLIGQSFSDIDTPENTEFKQLDFKVLQNQMRQNRAEISYLKKLIESKGYQAKTYLGTFSPQITAVGSYGLDRDLSSNLSQNQKQSKISLEVSFNLFNGFQDKQNYEATRYEALSIQSQLDDLLHSSDLELFNALESYSLAQSQIEVAKISLLQAQENYRITQDRYKQRIERISTLLDAQVLLTQAKANLANAEFNVQLAKAQIARITQSDF